MQMEMDKELSPEEVRISKMMAKALRHRPEVFGLVLDAHGWVDADALIEAIRARGMAFDRARMDRIVQLNNKRRFAYSDDGTKIRASQGHTIDVDVEMTEAAPPVLLYHGTLEKNGASIWNRGLLPMKRQYLTLSLYYDRQVNRPLLTSSSYPTRTQDFGINLKFQLAR